MIKTARIERTCAKCSAVIPIGSPVYYVPRQTPVKFFHGVCKPVESISAGKWTEDQSATSKPETTTTEGTVNAMIEALSAHVMQKVDGKLAGIQPKIDEEALTEKLVKAVMEKTEKPRRVEIAFNGTVKEVKGYVHEKFETLLKLIKSGEKNFYLYGAPGAGKSHTAHQVAESLMMEWGYISLNPQTPDSRLLGFIDAGGTYRPTVFYDRYKNGGIFCIDEMDNASASLLTTLNSGLENGHMSFPCGIVARHETFILIASGNTTGRGANPAFPERRQFDSAFMERFVYMEWTYDYALEKAITNEINPRGGKWLDYVQNLRQWAKTANPRLVVSPRASYRGARLLSAGFDAPEVAEMVIFKGLDAQAKKAIETAVPYPSRG